MTSDIYPTAPDDASGRPSRKGGFSHDRLDPGPYRTGSGWRRPAAAARRLQPGIPPANRRRAVLRHAAALRDPAALWHSAILHAGPGSGSTASQPASLANPADDPAAGRGVCRAADSASTAETHHAT